MCNTPTEEEIERYRRNKADGGSDGIDGVRYESRVAAWVFIQIATIARKHTIARATVCRQDLSFVNDLHVSARKRILRCEMKSGTSKLTWGKAFKTLGWDFRQQIAEDERAGIKASYYLYVADKENAQRLKKTPPPGVKVEHFPDSSVPSEIDSTIRGFSNRLTELLPEHHRERVRGSLLRGAPFSFLLDKTDLFNILQAFIVAADMLRAGYPENFDYVLKIASQRSDGLFCTQPRNLRAEVIRKLANIEDIDVVSCDGIVSYTLDNGIVGRLAVSLDRPEGEVFEHLIMQDDVQTSDDVLWAFEEAEKLLE